VNRTPGSPARTVVIGCTGSGKVNPRRDARRPHRWDPHNARRTRPRRQRTVSGRGRDRGGRRSMGVRWCPLLRRGSRLPAGNPDHRIRSIPPHGHAPRHRPLDAREPQTGAGASGGRRPHHIATAGGAPGSTPSTRCDGRGQPGRSATTNSTTCSPAASQVGPVSCPSPPPAKSPPGWRSQTGPADRSSRRPKRSAHEPTAASRMTHASTRQAHPHAPGRSPAGAPRRQLPTLASGVHPRCKVDREERCVASVENPLTRQRTVVDRARLSAHNDAVPSANLVGRLHPIRRSR
jgi:hypothetical protein